jgi:2,4-dienoyl-CoA reductase-like NADH-dependent reductase (Old Yellow Enzyme family)
MDKSEMVPGAPIAAPPSLFTPLTIRGLTLENRVVISPMCQHAATLDGGATDWHLVHLGKFALGGAGLIFTESTAVHPDGRIGVRDLGLWSDEQIEPLRRVVRFVREQGAAIGIQLAHAGRKAGSHALWDGGTAFTEAELRDPGDGRQWRRLGPSPIAAGPEWSVPEAVDSYGIATIIEDFVAATRRARECGFDAVELHFGHGYLVTSFLSPLSNHRTDAYGGDRGGRMRLALEIAARVRAEWPADRPLFCRISAVDGAEGGWGIDDSVVLAQALQAAGVDVIDCSSGGLTEETRRVAVPRGLGFQLGFAERIRRETDGMLTQAVGMILDGPQAEAALRAGSADLIAIGREALYDPYWAHRAAEQLGQGADFSTWPVRHGAWLAKRQQHMGPVIQARRRTLRTAVDDIE